MTDLSLFNIQTINFLTFKLKKNGFKRKISIIIFGIRKQR